MDITICQSNDVYLVVWAARVSFVWVLLIFIGCSWWVRRLNSTFRAVVPLLMLLIAHPFIWAGQDDYCNLAVLNSSGLFASAAFLAALWAIYRIRLQRNIHQAEDG